MIIKRHFHKKGFALGLVLKQRLAEMAYYKIYTTYDTIQRPYVPSGEKRDEMVTIQYNSKIRTKIIKP